MVSVIWSNQPAPVLGAGVSVLSSGAAVLEESVSIVAGCLPEGSGVLVFCFYFIFIFFLPLVEEINSCRKLRMRLEARRVRMIAGLFIAVQGI